MLALMLVWGGLVAYASEQARGKPRSAPQAPERVREVNDGDDPQPVADLLV